MSRISFFNIQGRTFRLYGLTPLSWGHFTTVGCGLLIVGHLFCLLALPGYTDDQASTEPAKTQAPQTKGASDSGGKWLPIPMFLTEPAFGYGFGMRLGYIHPSKEEDNR